MISTPPTRSADAFAVQVGAFSQRSEADQLRARLQAKYGIATLIYLDRDRVWCVLVGLEPTEDRANALAEQLAKEDTPVSWFVSILHNNPHLYSSVRQMRWLETTTCG